MKVLFALFFVAVAFAQHEQVVTADRHITTSSSNVLMVTKDANPKVDAVDRILYNIDEMERMNPEYISILENERMSRMDLEETIFLSLGETWTDRVNLSGVYEDLTLLEVMRLSSSLNEMNYEEQATHGHQTRNPGGKQGGAGSYSWDTQGVCFCHGTAKTWSLGNVHNSDVDSDFIKPSGTTFKKGYPFYGIRMWKKSVPSGHKDAPGGSQHGQNPYNNDYRDCLLGTTDDTNYARHCCTGGCVITGNGEDATMADVGLDHYCDITAEDARINTINEYTCVDNSCQTATCTCDELYTALNSKDCPCDEDYTQDCTCTEALDGLRIGSRACTCDQRDTIIDYLVAEDGLECACEQAISLNRDHDNSPCETCEQTIDIAFDISSDGQCCNKYMNYVDVRDQDKTKDSCDCNDGNRNDILEYGFCDCCESFDLLTNEDRNLRQDALSPYGVDRNVDNCQPWGPTEQSHAAYIGDCCGNDEI